MQLTGIDQITQQYRHIYLQPHYDDAIFSCGGAVALQVGSGQQVLLVTIFGGTPPAGQALSPFAAQLIQRDGLGADAAEAVRNRQAEDLAAATMLGADVLWLEHPEALYRGAPAYYQDEQSLFGAVHPNDLSLDGVIAEQLNQIHEKAPLAALYAPLGVGNHVDHQLVCSAADRLAQQKLNVKFYEDFPYVARTTNALEARQKALGIQMEQELVEISHQPARYKEEASLQYRSQIPANFGTEDRLRQLLTTYTSSIRRTYPGIQIERYWTW
jgi:LmbE family N-acetylglucosaminyl deacetylase